MLCWNLPINGKLHSKARAKVDSSLMLQHNAIKEPWGWGGCALLHVVVQGLKLSSLALSSPRPLDPLQDFPFTCHRPEHRHVAPLSASSLEMKSSTVPKEERTACILVGTRDF